MNYEAKRKLVRRKISTTFIVNKFSIYNITRFRETPRRYLMTTHFKFIHHKISQNVELGSETLFRIIVSKKTPCNHFKSSKVMKVEKRETPDEKG